MKRGITLFVACVVACVVAAGGLFVVASPAGATKYTISIHSAKPSVIVNQSVTITGAVAPKVPGKHVVLQQHYGGTWHTLVVHSTTSQSLYSFTVKFNKVGTWYFHVVYGLFFSATLHAYTYRWHHLTDLGIFSDQRFSTYSINGTTYTHSPQVQVDSFWHEKHLEYNLRHLCTRVKGVAGLADYTSSSAVARASVSADGVVKFSHDYTVGHSDSFYVHTDNAYRVRFTGEWISGSPEDFVTLGDPQALCLF